jgi:uncharacterized membrane protein YkvA (DUF1232 family)
MSGWEWLLLGLAVAALIWLGLVCALVILGRRGDALAIARFIPDCIVLFRRLLGDERVPRSRKLLLVAVLGYLACPIDLVPDFIPVAGQLDDAIIVALVIRSVLRSAGAAILREHWPGPESSLAVLERLAYGRPAAAQPRDQTDHAR